MHPHVVYMYSGTISPYNLSRFLTIFRVNFYLHEVHKGHVCPSACFIYEANFDGFGRNFVLEGPHLNLPGQLNFDAYRSNFTQ